MSKRITVAGLLLVAFLAAFITHRDRTTSAPAQVVQLSVDFLPVESIVPQQTKPRMSSAESVSYGLAYAVAYTKAALQGNKMTWSCVDGAPLLVALGPYRGFAGQPVFVQSNLRSTKVGAFNFSSLTTRGLVRSFEEQMKTNRIVFVRDSTNAVWVMDATNEVAFRQQFGLSQ